MNIFMNAFLRFFLLFSLFFNGFSMFPRFSRFPMGFYGL